MARIGWMTGEFAVGGLSEGLKRLLGSGTSDANFLLNPVAAKRLARRLSRMRGAAMKIGQMLSLLDEDILPPEFAEALGILRASADTMPESQVRKVLTREYGKNWRSLFRSFDFEPIAAASIGQVHTAVAADGRELALKMQYPGIAESIDSDVDNLATAVKAARILPMELALDDIVDETKAQLRQEADYLQEAQLLERYSAKLEGDPRFVVPGVHHELTTQHVLAMDRLFGVPLEDLAGPEHPQELRDQMAGWLLELLFRELFDFRLMQTDPNFSNYFLLSDEHKVGLLDFGSTSEIDAELSEHYRLVAGAVVNNDRAALRQAFTDLDFLRPEDSEARVESLLDTISTMFEPFAYDGVYDFGSSDFAVRARDLGMELTFRHGFIRTPPPKMVFPQRKLDGSLMLCLRLRARVNVRELLEPFLRG